MFNDTDYYMEIFVALMGGVILFMAISTILLLKNWKKWTPIFKKIGSFLVFLYFSAMFFLVFYKLVSENWVQIYETSYYYFNLLFSIIIIPLAILLLIAQYVIIYLIFNEYASVAKNPDEGEVRSSAVIIATVLGGTLNLVFVALITEFGPLASAFDAVDRYSRQAGYEDGLSFCTLLAMSCWSLIPLTFIRWRRANREMLSAES